MEVMKCSICGATENLYNDSILNKTYICRACNTAKCKKYRQTPKGKSAILRAIKKYESANPDRKKAWSKAQSISKQPCAECGKSPTHKHHPDIKYPLRVIHLCPLHHKQAHAVKVTVEA